MTGKRSIRPVVLCVLDGWGIREETENNAIALAKTPVWDRLMATSPHARLDASEDHVGLPEGQMGNSEVGHMNLGAGRVVLQELQRINTAFAEDAVAKIPAFRSFIDKTRASGGTVHLIGLVSPGGVHSHQDQIAALARLLRREGLPYMIHALLDGRDTPPSSAKDYVRELLEKAPGSTIATVCGRYYAMDRDKRWDRVEKAYRMLVDAEGRQADDPIAAIERSYKEDVTDEFVEPAVIGDYRGMREGDAILMANFRADRARQILTALLDPDFDGFERRRVVSFAAALGMVEYSEALNRLMESLFPQQRLDNVLGEVIAKAGMRQLRIAETEKYAHVTFFFNGGEETSFAEEERVLVPSPKVATYDLKPEMSAVEVTDRLVEAIEDRRFDFILVNFANTDMVGHTGKLDAAIRAVETVDECLGRLDKAVRAAGGVLLITADHGNAEQMRDEATGQPHTAHTRNLVPLILAGRGHGAADLQDGRLADVAPTILELIGVEQPAEMTGRSLIVHVGEQREAG